MDCADKDGEISRSVALPLRDPPPVGILRLDVVRPRRASASEFRILNHGEPTSPQPSVDRLSVTFAEDSQKSEVSTRFNLFNTNLSPVTMDKVHFPQPAEGENSDDEDYSASVSAIMQRRASTRKSRRKSTRRASSPFSPDILPGTENERRRSSCYTTSSGETAISVEDNLASEVTQAQIYENIRLHKEVLSNVKMQPWHMRKKIRLVLQAKNYVKKHEGVLQERLAQSHSTKDMLARWHIYLVKRWQHVKRETANLSNWLIPWELRIKEIESHFGSVVASYFTFLRWLFWVNLVTSVILIAFVTIPELLISKVQPIRKRVLSQDRYNATNFYTLLDFEGILKYSPLFYGWYTDRDVHGKGYRLPLAYFMTGLTVYVYNFVATLRKMAENSRMSKLSEKEDECTFSWKVFTGWDYMIGNSETAANRVASIVMGFKEALLEEAEKKKDTKNWKVIFIRILVNICVCGLLVLSAYAVVMVVKRSTEPEAKKNFWRMNEITIVMNLISLLFPMFFEVLGLGEQYHPRKQLRLQLARIMLLNLLNLYSLNFALFDKINDMQKEWDTALSGYYNSTNCTRICTNSTTVRKLRELESASQISENVQWQPNSYYYYDYEDANYTEANSFYSTDNQQSSTPFSDNSTELSLSSTFSAYYSSRSDSDILDLDDLQKFFEYISFDGPSDRPENFSEYTETSNTTNLPPNQTFIEDEEFSSTPIWTTSAIFTTSDVSSTILDTTIAPTDGTTTETSSIASSTASKANTPQDLTTSTMLPTINIKNQLCPCKIDSIEAFISTLDYRNQSKLRSLCWETMFGQELVKLTVMDLFMTVLSTLAMDFFRGVFVRVMNNCWCWDLEKIFPQYGDFKVAENILHLVNNQGMVWMGMFFSPGIIGINVVKLYIMVYFRSFIVLTCNVPHKVVFRASRSNNFYYALLLSMLFLCVIPVGYAIVWVRPSKHCGPFSNYDKISHIFTQTLREIMPSSVHQILDYIASPGVVIPLLVLMILIIYYLLSLTDALREANNDLKVQLRRERTEERRKLFQIADRRRRVGSEGSGELGQTPFGKWKKLLYNLPSGKSFDETPKQESEENQNKAEDKEIKQEPAKTKDFFSKLIKRALRKSIPSEDEDGTDTDVHDSLPEDIASVKEAKSQTPTKETGKKLSFQRAVHGSLIRKNKNGPATPEMEVVTAASAPGKSRRDSFDLKKHQENKRISSNNKVSKDFREDSLTSTWSDNIPVITISKSDSLEKMEGKTQAEVEEKASVTSSDTLVQEKVDTRVRSRYVLKKQKVTEDEEVAGNVVGEKFGQKQKHRDKLTNEEVLANSDAKTESSNDYKDSAFS